MAKDPLTAPEVVYPDVLKSENGASASASETEVLSSSVKKGQTFTNSGLHSRLYKPIANYEGNHRYDPDFDWEPEEERKVVRKVTYLSILRCDQC
jgi:hypothetical protein